MKQMVKDFETELETANVPEETMLYREVTSFLQGYVGREVDLEAVFSIVDSVVNWSPDRIGLAALYQAARGASGKSAVFPATSRTQAPAPPSDTETRIARSLRERFEGFIRSRCEIPAGSHHLIEEAYDQLFRYIEVRIGGRGWGNRTVGDWRIFTTNYDTVLEHYWIDHAKLPLITGFRWNEVAGMKVSDPDTFLGEGLKLFKLHGSITWLNDPEYGLTEQRIIPRDMKKATGTSFLGQVMLYPIEEKELYVEPYLTMFQQLNRELAATDRWVVIGYSFADRFIRDVFLHNARPSTRLVILHPSGEHFPQRLSGFRGRLSIVKEHFGAGSLQNAPQMIWNELAK